MPISADRCQVTWGPNPLNRADVGKGGSFVSVCRCPQGVFACGTVYTLFSIPFWVI